MFTGIVEEVGRVERLAQRDGHWLLEVRGAVASQGGQLGDSIAVNGVCLTLTALEGERMRFGLAPETLSRTNLGGLNPGDRVNLERALPANGRLGGHFVQGHVDGTGRIARLERDGDSLRVAVSAPAELTAYCVAKGFICVDGVSLTLIDVLADRFTFMLVDYTQHHATLGAKQVGEVVNLEVDILAKYARKFLAPYPSAP